MENVSYSIADEQLFESLLINFWKILCDSNIYDKYAGSKKNFDPTRNGYLQDHHFSTINGKSVSENAPFGTFLEPTSYRT